MKIVNLTLSNFRNHKLLNIELSDENLIIGKNGSGKTNILESISLLFGLKGFKKQSLSNIIKFNECYMYVKCELLKDKNITYLKLKYDNKKSISIDEVPLDNLTDYLYSHPLLAYTPDNLGILSKEQQERRNFIDRYIFYIYKNHINNLKSYNRLINQKNIELDKENKNNIYIDTLNEQIIKLSKHIRDKRYNFIMKLNNNLKKLYNYKEFKMEKILLSYKTNINNLSLLDLEKKRGRSEYGIHKDKIDIVLENKMVEKFSSFGQKKSFCLLSLLSTLKLVEEYRKMSIITLLDDFEAGLDEERSSNIRSILSENRQTIYTGVENLRLGFKNIINLQG